MTKKITHVVKGLDNGPFAGSGHGVYGKKDLTRITAAAKAAGIPITIHEVTPDKED